MRLVISGQWTGSHLAMPSAPPPLHVMAEAHWLGRGRTLVLPLPALWLERAFEPARYTRTKVMLNILADIRKREQSCQLVNVLERLDKCLSFPTPSLL